MARAPDSWRISVVIPHNPHCIIVQSCCMVYEYSRVNAEQAHPVSIVVGAGAQRFGLYTGSAKES